MAATRTRTESSTAISSVDSASNNQQDDETPTRRTTTRTRKLPSRLLPSPSPPPTRPAFTHAKQLKSETIVLPSTPTVVIPQSAAKPKRSSPSLDNAVASDHESIDAEVGVDGFGPGKRKRRPSSMYRPPSTLTATEAAVPTLTSTKTKKKGRSTSPDASIGHVKLPSVHAPLTYGKKRRFTKLSSGGRRHELSDDGADEHDTETDLAVRLSTQTPHQSTQDGSGLSPPPLLPRDGSVRIQMPAELTQPTFTRGGQVSVSPESSHKRARLGVKSFVRSNDVGDKSAYHRLSEDLRASKLDAQSFWRANDALPSSPHSPAVSRFEHCNFIRASHSSFNSATSGRSHSRNTNVTFDTMDDEEEDEDEDDFHQAMLNADLDFFDSQKTELAAAGPWLMSEPQPSDQDMDDTPATTPRSPQSGCDPATPGSPSIKGEDAVEDAPSIRDTVFVHALPTTQVGANKPHQHAGSLTLSLPYSPEVAASSPRLKPVDIECNSTSSADPRPTSRTSTPILQRRKYAGGSHGLSALKFGSEVIERLNTGASHFMQLSPMIELDSPLLSPGLALSLGSKGVDPPSPFVMGVSTLPELDQPAALALPPSKDMEKPTERVQTTRAVPADSNVNSRVTSQSKHEMMALKRPALPPPRQIRFTTLTTPNASGATLQQQQPQQPQPPTTRSSVSLSQTNESKTTRSRTVDPTPDLIYSASSSPESVSESGSPSSRSDSDSCADAEVETILFGPPEKLDLRELDHVWGGSKTGLNGLVAAAKESNSPALRRTKSTRSQTAGLTK